MKILLVNPPSEMLKQEGFSVLPPLGLLYIGAVLEKAGHEVKIVDCVAQNWKNPKKLKKGTETIFRFDVPETFWPRLFSEFNPQLIGITNLFATSENICLELAQKLKILLPQTKIIIGGTNASARADFFLRQGPIDFVGLGEGEYVLLDLARALEQKNDYSNIAGLCYRRSGENFIAGSFRWVQDLNELPFPAYHLLTCSVENYFHGLFSSFFAENRILTTTTTRGCVRNCVFCSGMKNLGQWRQRSPENVIAELEYLKKTYRIKEIAFVDANINLIKERFVRLMGLMKEKRLNLRWTPFGGIYVQTFTTDLVKMMRQTGCHSMNLAIEHGDLKMQKYIGKIVPIENVKPIVAECRRQGVWVHGYFVLGLPGETKESLEQCLKYAKEANLDSVSFFIGTPLPGSRLYAETFNDKRLETENLRFISQKIWWTEMDPSYLTAAIKRFMISFIRFKIGQELKPRNLFLRLKNLRLNNLKLYSKILERFFKNLIFR